MSKRRPIQVLLADDQPNVRSALHRLLKHEPGVKVVGEASEARELVAGLLNTLAHVRRVFRQPIFAILGGTHLLDADEAYLQHVINVLREAYGTPHLYLNHCTGERAYVALRNAFGDRVKPCPVGTTLTID